MSNDIEKQKIYSIVKSNEVPTDQLDLVIKLGLLQLTNIGLAFVEYGVDSIKTAIDYCESSDLIDSDIAESLRENLDNPI